MTLRLILYLAYTYLLICSYGYGKRFGYPVYDIEWVITGFNVYKQQVKL